MRLPSLLSVTLLCAPLCLAGCDFGSDDPPYTLILHSPSGEVGAYGSATGVIDDSAGFAAFNFDLNRGGLWHYRWESASELGPERSFFVQFSPTRS